MSNLNTIITTSFKENLLNQVITLSYYILSFEDCNSEQEFINSNKTDYKQIEGLLTNNHILVIRINELSVQRYKSIGIYDEEKRLCFIISNIQFLNEILNNLYIDISNLDKPKGIRLDSNSITHNHLTAERISKEELDNIDYIESTTPSSSTYISNLFKSKSNSPEYVKLGIKVNDYGILFRNENNLYCELLNFSPCQCKNYFTDSSSILLVNEVLHLDDYIKYDGILYYDDEKDKISMATFQDVFYSFVNGNITSENIPCIDNEYKNKSEIIYVDNLNYASYNKEIY